MNGKKRELIKIVGEKSVLDESEALESYSKDLSFTSPIKPWLVVKPQNAEEVLGIIRWANQTGTPLVPVSSGPPHFRGDTVPSMTGALIIDLSRMRRIIKIDRRNRIVMIEPGVTFSQAQPKLAKEGLRLSMPLLPRKNKSVIASLLEREPIMIPKYQWTLLEPLRCLEILWGDGSRLWTGDAGPWGTLETQWTMKHAQVMPLGWGQADYYRFVSGAQGTMGIVTWATIKCEILPQLHEILFVPAVKLENLIDFAYGLLRIKYADEFLFLNNSSLAFILGGEVDEIRVLKKELPPWVLILGVAGRDLLPKERVKFQIDDISEMAHKYHLQLSPTIQGLQSKNCQEVLINPCKEPYWKLRYKGRSQEIFFLTTLDKIPKFVEAMYRVAFHCDYSPTEIGIYVQPLMRGVGCHCEFNIPYHPENEEEASKVQKLFTEASKEMTKYGAYFSRPYGSWGKMVYDNDAQTTAVLRKLKKIFDPNNVMNPGKLCF
jgi:FAD/FMN-containing dehydrogenase